MAKFYVAGCFTDDIVVNADRNTIEKRNGGPALYLKKALEKMGETPDVAEGKKGIVEIHFKDGEEIGRVSSACRVNLAPIASSIVLVSAIGNEVNLDKLKGDFREIHVDAKGFVRDPEHFGGRRNWALKNVEKVKVLKTTQLDMQYLPENLVSHLRKNGVMLVAKTGGKFTLIDRGAETDYELGYVPTSDTVGSGATLLASFSAEYSRGKDAKKAMEGAVKAVKEFLAERHAKSPAPNF